MSPLARAAEAKAPRSRPKPANAADKEALVNVVAARTGKSKDESAKIVDRWEQTYDQAREKLARDVARHADLILFVISSDMQRREFEALAELREAQKPILLVFNQIDRYPDADRELDINRSKNTGLPDALARTLVDVVRGLRELDLRKAPSISETIDWARTLAVLGASELTAELLSQTANVVVKYDRDLRRTLEVLPKLVDPNAEVPSSRQAHSHSHGHGHSHSHADGEADHSHDEPGAGPPDPAGIEKRASKDEPGRHEAANYGIAGGQRPEVKRSQGERSFNTRGARRRPV